MAKPNYAILEYNDITRAYDTKLNLRLNDVIEYSFIEAMYPDSDEFEIKLKFDVKYERYIANNDRILTTKQAPMIVAKLLGNEVIWFSFITEREKVETREEKYYRFRGVGFTWFLDYRIINSNRNYTTTGEELPDDFGLYISNTTIKNHLDYFFRVCYLNPLALTYGRLSNTIDEGRYFKGLDSVTVQNVPKTVSMRIEQTSLKEAIDELYTSLGYNLVHRQYLVDGKVKIEVKQSVRIAKDIIRKTVDLLEIVNSQYTTINSVFGFGWGNNSRQQTKQVASYFTNLEKTEDFSFIAKGNNGYLISPIATSLKKETAGMVEQLLKLNSSSFFTEMRCGDIVYLNERNFMIKQLQEKYSNNALEYNVQVSEVD